MSGVVLFDRPAPRVARLLIDRPDKRNAIDRDVRQTLLDAIAPLAADKQTRALVLGGAGGMFSAGGDLPSMVGLDDAGARERMRHVHALVRLVASLRVPVVSAVEGFAAGAAVGLALLGDRIVVGESTRLLFPFLSLGLTPDWGQAWSLPRRVGVAVAQRLFTDGVAVGGAEALRIGLADTLVPDADVMNEAIRQAEALARLPQDAFARTKARLAEPAVSLAEELAREELDQAACLTSADFAEGHDAFASKRAPDFVVARATLKKR